MRSRMGSVWSFIRQRCVVFGAVLALAGLGGCTHVITPAQLPVAPAITGKTFSHEVFDRVLQRFVDEKGLVDYSGLQHEPDGLDRYLALLAAYSPDSDPELFPTDNDRLAYWINAYNAAVLKLVLEHYPIDSVTDVHAPATLFFLPRTAGFFYLQRVTLGGEEMSLSELESDILRKRFAEPEIHFAINCASVGCPQLSTHAFTPEHLDQQLGRRADLFFSETRNLSIDHEDKIVSFSSILKWYSGDFTDWYEREFPEKDATLLKYAALHVDEKRAEELRWAEGSGYTIEFVDYDWTLNDQHPR